jgi:hypothetical protein
MPEGVDTAMSLEQPAALEPVIDTARPKPCREELFPSYVRVLGGRKLRDDSVDRGAHLDNVTLDVARNATVTLTAPHTVNVAFAI